jgi:hypothetical protein
MHRNSNFVFGTVLSLFFLSALKSFADERITPIPFWGIEDCQVVGKSADIRLSTDGHLSHQTIHFRLVSDVPLKKAPEMQLNTAKFTGFDLEGTGQGFGFEMLYTPMQASYFLHENATLVIGYEPIYTDADGKHYTYHAQFPMNDLPALLAEVVERCPR